ncbi:unnamed protein product [Caretta caretta]
MIGPELFHLGKSGFFQPDDGWLQSGEKGEEFFLSEFTLGLGQYGRASLAFPKCLATRTVIQRGSKRGRPNAAETQFGQERWTALSCVFRSCVRRACGSTGMGYLQSTDEA